MVNVKEELLVVNPYSRSGEKRIITKGIVVHWLAAPMQHAHQCRQFFNSRADGKSGYGGAHYIVDLDGAIIRCIPDDEVAYHVGSSQIDPKSGHVYTDICRKQLTSGNPNSCTVGIEHCHIDGYGKMTDETNNASIQLVAWLCLQYGLNPLVDILTHQQVVGWKNCPRWFVDHPTEFDEYRALVAAFYTTLK